MLFSQLFINVFCLTVCTVMMAMISTAFDVERDHSGDQFTTQCQDCRDLRAQCVISTDMWLCCSRCRCYAGDTFYKTGVKCSVNPAVDEGCTLRMNQYQYSGHKVPIYKLFNNISKDMGDVMKENDYDILRLQGCRIVGASSTFSDPAQKTWRNLYEGGRHENDFVITTDKSKGSSLLKFQGEDAAAYQGMLIKFSLRCRSVSSCLIVKIYGKRNYISPIPSTVATVTTEATKPTTLYTSISPSSNTTEAGAKENGDPIMLIVIIVSVLVLLALVVCFVIVLLKRRSRKSNDEAFLFSLKPLPSISKMRLLSQRSTEKKKKVDDEGDEYLQPIDAGVPHHHQEAKVTGNAESTNVSKLPLVPNAPSTPVYMETCSEHSAPYATCDDSVQTTENNQPQQYSIENIYADPNAKPKNELDQSSYQALDDSTLTRHSGYIPLDRSTLLRNQAAILSAEQEAKHCYATIEDNENQNDYETAQDHHGHDYHVVSPSPSAGSSKGFDALKDRPASTEYTEIAPIA